MFIYALKSAIVLSLLYLPYVLMLRRESFFRFNRAMLCAILAASLVLPLCNMPMLSLDSNPVVSAAQMQMIEIGIPIAQGIVPDAEGVAAAGEASGVWGWLSTFTPRGSQPVVSWFVVVATLYIIVAVALLILRMRDYVRLRSIVRHNCTWQRRQDCGVTICCHREPIPPFSWHRTIVISEADYEQNGACIIRHEMGHITSNHSLDILLLTLVQLVQWFNPLVWLLGQSLQEVHEYEADNYVLRGGFSLDEYRYLLIKKAVGTSAYVFANNFNHSLLKRRITMMCQKKSNPWQRAKALYAIPVALLALSAFATPEFIAASEAASEAVDAKIVPAAGSAEKPVALIENNDASAPEDLAEPAAAALQSPEAAPDSTVNTLGNDNKVSYETDKEPLFFVDGISYSKEEVLSLNPKVIESITVLKGERAIEMYGEKAANGVVLIKTAMRNAMPQVAVDDVEVFEVVEHSPEFKGGAAALMAFLSENLCYPKAAHDEGREGRVMVRFTVGKDGLVYDTEVLHTKGSDAIGADLQEEAVRVINLTSGKWHPGTQRGEAVNVRFVLPINFRLAPAEVAK